MDKFSDEAEEIRAETAAESPELQEHDALAELQAKLEDAQQKALYAAAEVQNVRRRAEQERVQAVTYANTGFARDMLSVKDNLDRALSHIPEGAREGELKNFIEGIEATARELDAVFSRHGVTRVESKGLPLDPNRHQAMIEIPSEEAEPGTIVEEMQAGYVLKDRLLRPALVGVAKRG